MLDLYAFHIAVAALGNGLAILLAALLLRDARQSIVARIGAALFIASIGTSLVLLPQGLLPGWLRALAFILVIPTLGLNLLFGRALLLDDFRMDWREWTVFGVLCCFGVVSTLSPLGLDWSGAAAATLAFRGLGIAVIAYVAGLAVTGFQNDLVEARRTIRIALALFACVTYALIAALGLVEASVTAEAIVFDVSSVIIYGALILWLVSLDADKFDVLARAESSHEPPDQSEVVRQRRAMWSDKLDTVLQDGTVWRDPSMTLGKLADTIGLAEHQLRELINSERGYRNFAEFLNGFRLRSAKEALANPTLVDMPILTIAMDAGFGSISAFNRAFRLEVGMTPSEYRSESFQTC